MKCDNCGYRFKEVEPVHETIGKVKDTEQGPRPAAFCGEGCWKQWIEDLGFPIPNEGKIYERGENHLH